MALPVLVGARFGRLTVISMAGLRLYGKKRKTMRECLCDCGKTTIVPATALRGGNTKSCGCYHDERCRERATKHGMARTKVYRHWSNMLTRCDNPRRKEFEFYHALGIGPELRNFESFYAILGDPPFGMTLDRIDNTKGYIVGNVRWANRTTQQRNKGNNKMLTFRGETRCAAEWCEVLNIPWPRLKMRLKMGWSVADALTKPKCY